MEQLKVGIGADTKNLEKGLKDAEKALKGFSDKSKKISLQLKKNAIESSKLSAEISKLDASFKKGTISESDFGKQMLKLTNQQKQLSNESKTLRSNLTNLNKSTQDLGGKGMGTLKKGAANGSAAMTSFSRTIQDAPFGLMGVSNNITNLTEQFGYLKKSTGSAKGALQAMLRDLKGFGGVTLAISLATSLMLVFGDTLFKTKDRAKELREEQDKLTKSLEDYEATLIGVQKTELEGAKSATKELVTLKLLKSQLEDNTLSNKKRLEAFYELQKRYPSYLSNISNEVALNKGLGGSYETLKKLIEDKAKADAASQNIVKNTKQELILVSQLEAERIKSAKTKLALENAEALALKRAGKERSGSNLSVQRALELRTELNGQIAKEKEIVDKITKLQNDSLVLANQIKEVGGVVPLDFSVGDTEQNKTRKKVKTLYSGLVEANIVGREAFNLSSSETPLQVLPPDFDEQAELFKIRLAEFNQSVAQIMQQGKFDTISGFAEAIGGALASGGNVLETAGNALLGSLGSIMVKYGKLILAFGLASEALKKAMQNPFGGGIAAVVAGIALIAIGSAISSFASSTASSGGSSGGSSSSGGGSYSAPNVGSGYSAPSSRGGYSGSSSGGTVVFEIAGQKLVGVLSRTLKQNRNLGGTLSLS